MSLDLHDVLALLGCGLVVAGVWWIHPPSALIGAGLLALVAGVVPKLSRPPRARR